MRRVSFVFGCDRTGCLATVRRSDPALRTAVRSVREAGWTVRKGRHFCPDHKPAVKP